jgi:divalent metal cation (Fe/Co/Zn/Cd) transporter
MLVVALGSGSVTLLGETIRSGLITLAAVWPLVVLGVAERDAGRRYEFGVGKLEQAGNTAIALALVVAGLWLAGRVYDLIVAGQSPTESLGLALAATANAAHTIRVGSSVWARSTAGAPKQHPIHGLPLPSASARFLPLLIVQVALTLAAIARDPAIALAAECLGAIFVALLMTVAGVRMLWQAVLDLIDHPLQGEVEESITLLLFEHGVDARELLGMRSRRSGRRVFVELTLDPIEAGSFQDLRERLERVRRRLEERVGDLDLAIRLSVPEADLRTAGGLDERR